MKRAKPQSREERVTNIDARMATLAAMFRMRLTREERGALVVEADELLDERLTLTAEGV